MTAADRTKRHTHTNTNDADTTTQVAKLRFLIAELANRIEQNAYVDWIERDAHAALGALVAELDRLREYGRVNATRLLEELRDTRAEFRADLAEARAELERVTRELDEQEGYPGIAVDFEKTKAELVAAAGRHQRLRDAAQPVVNALDAYASVGGVDLETLRAVLEEGQQP